MTSKKLKHAKIHNGCREKVLSSFFDSRNLKLWSSLENILKRFLQVIDTIQKALLKLDMDNNWCLDLYT